MDRGPDFRILRIIAKIREWTARSVPASLDRACALRELACKAQGRDEARWVGYTLSRDVESRAVIGRGADQGQAQGHVDRAVECDGFHRDQRLIVIHRDDDVVAFARAGAKQS